MEKSLRELEAEVEAARAKIATDVAILRSAAIRTQFVDSAQQDLHHLKDTAVSSAVELVRSKAADFVETLKAKAAQNPAAVLAVAAGIGWRIYKSPPIASALVGLGLYSLLKSKAEPTEYPMETAKRRAKEQIASAAEAARSGAVSVTSSIVEKVDEITQPARDATGEIMSDVRGQLHDAQDVIAEKAKSAKGSLPASFANKGNSRSESSTRVDATQLRDTALLAFAGIAVAASVGLAWQRRLSTD
jgi:uncharacterized protein YdeI (BOF family)